MKRRKFIAAPGSITREKVLGRIRGIAATKVRTAHHEAGHAVIGRVLGMRSGDVSIIPEGRTSGRADVSVWLTLDDWWGNPKLVGRTKECAFIASIITSMAGREAEIACLGMIRGKKGDRYDLQDIHKMREEGFAGMADEEWFRLTDRLRAKTHRLVRRHRKSIEYVARALIQRGELSGKEVDVLLSEQRQQV